MESRRSYHSNCLHLRAWISLTLKELASYAPRALMHVGVWIVSWPRHPLKLSHVACLIVVSVLWSVVLIRFFLDGESGLIAVRCGGLMLGTGHVPNEILGALLSL